MILHCVLVVFLCLLVFPTFFVLSHLYFHFSTFRNKNPPWKFWWLRPDEYDWRYVDRVFVRISQNSMNTICWFSAGLAERTRGAASSTLVNGWLGITIVGYYLTRLLQLAYFERWWVQQRISEKIYRAMQTEFAQLKLKVRQSQIEPKSMRFQPNAQYIF